MLVKTVAPALVLSSLAFAEAPTLVAVPDTPVVLKLWEDRYAISLDGAQFTEPYATSYDLKLQHSRFDPIAAVPAIPPELAADAGNTLFIVQYLTQPLAEFTAAVDAAGGETVAYVANHGAVVRMTAREAGVVEAMAFVRWVGPLHPAFRLEPVVIDDLLAGELGDEPLPYHIHVTRSGLGEKQAVGDRIAALGGVVEPIFASTHLMNADLTAAQLLAVIRMDEVLYVDRRLPVQTYLNNVRADGGANVVEGIAGYSGQGVRAEVIDGGLLTSHQAWATPPLIHAPNSTNTSHGTQVYGCVFSDGTGNSSGRGLIPDAQGIFSSYSNLGNRYNHTMELVQAPWNAVFQTNSWGTCCSTTYGTQAAYMDEIIFDSDLLILQAQANTGGQSSDVHAWAKNVVSIGGIRHFNSLTRSDDSWSFSGSIGPADDGRIKPDLAYWYDSITTTSNSGGYTGGFGGTSAATPMTAGHFGLMFQMWSDGIFGNTVNAGGTVFDNRPKMATAKALIINSAHPYDFVGAGADLTRVHQGWGLADVEGLYDLRDETFVVDETDVLTNLQSTIYKLAVEPGEQRFRATMVYKDPPGNPGANHARINDLNLKVTTPSGTFYWGNNGLMDDNLSTPGGNPNDADTVENVWLEDPEPGTWTIEVIARSVIEDSHVETPEVDVDYALVVTGVTEVLAECAADITGDDVVDVLDFLEVLGQWGQAGGPADVNNDGTVDTLDFLIVLAEWGPCP